MFCRLRAVVSEKKGKAQNWLIKLLKIIIIGAFRCSKIYNNKVYGTHQSLKLNTEYHIIFTNKVKSNWVESEHFAEVNKHDILKSLVFRCFSKKYFYVQSTSLLLVNSGFTLFCDFDIAFLNNTVMAIKAPKAEKIHRSKFSFV